MAVPPRFVFDVLLRSDLLYWLLITLLRKPLQRVTGLVPRGFTVTADEEEALRHALDGNLPISERVDGFIFETYTTAAEYQASVSHP